MMTHAELTEFSKGLIVYIYRRPNFLDDNFEMESYMGMAQLRNMFITKKIDLNTKSMFLSFPERWLNIIQERSLYERIHHYYPNCKDIEIKTHSVYIIQNTINTSCRIFKDEVVN